MITGNALEMDGGDSGCSLHRISPCSLCLCVQSIFIDTYAYLCSLKSDAACDSILGYDNGSMLPKINTVGSF